MEIGEIRTRIVPDEISIHGADNLVAESGGYQGSHWLYLGEIKQGRFRETAVLHFRGPDAAAKVARLATAINEAMSSAEPVPAPLSQAAE